LAIQWSVSALIWMHLLCAIFLSFAMNKSSWPGEPQYTGGQSSLQLKTVPRCEEGQSSLLWNKLKDHSELVLKWSLLLYVFVNKLQFSLYCTNFFCLRPHKRFTSGCYICCTKCICSKTRGTTSIMEQSSWVRISFEKLVYGMHLFYVWFITLTPET
jgi:hypothetical protein